MSKARAAPASIGRCVGCSIKVAALTAERPSPQEQVDASRMRLAQARLARLTRRERQILDLAARHLTSKQIGPRLAIQPASVDTFMQTINRKLEVGGRKDAVRVYLDALDVDALRRDGPSLDKVVQDSSDPSAQGRDDLDFGASPISGPGPIPSPVTVFETEDGNGSEVDDAAERSLAGQRGDLGSERVVRRRGGGDLRGPSSIADAQDPDGRTDSRGGAPSMGAASAWTFDGAGRMDRADRVDRRLGDPVWFLSSAGRRLLLMAIITLILGLVVAGATAAGYDLTGVIDRLFLEHVYNAQGAKPRGTTS